MKSDVTNHMEGTHRPWIAGHLTGPTLGLVTTVCQLKSVYIRNYVFCNNDFQKMKIETNIQKKLSNYDLFSPII